MDNPNYFETIQIILDYNFLFASNTIFNPFELILNGQVQATAFTLSLSISIPLLCTGDNFIFTLSLFLSKILTSFSFFGFINKVDDHWLYFGILFCFA